jgi:hypothetical protein
LGVVRKLLAATEGHLRMPWGKSAMNTRLIRERQQRQSLCAVELRNANQMIKDSYEQLITNVDILYAAADRAPSASTADRLRKKAHEMKERLKLRGISV